MRFKALHTSYLVLAALVAALAAPLAAHAAPGDLDATFGIGGRFTADFGYGGDDYPADALWQPDGKLLVVGDSSEGLAIARYGADGSLDATFADDGRLVDPDRHAAVGVALQPDGKILVVTNDFVGEILRYEADGTPDTSFSGDGRQTIGSFTSFVTLQAVAVQDDGRIVVAGGADADDTEEDFLVARLEPDGTPDDGFSGDGIQTTDFVGRWNAADDLAIQPDGRILAVGLTAIPDEDSFGSDFAVARYNANGSLDATFDDDGRQTTHFVDGSQEARSVAIEPDGGIVVAGRAWPNVGSASMAVARYDEEGALDETFGGDGKQLLTPSAADSADAEDVALQADGDIILAGRRGTADGEEHLMLVRLAPDGSPDESFSGDGFQTIDLGSPFERAAAVLVQPDQRVVTAGVAGEDFVAARFDADGELDDSFSGDGVEPTDFPGLERANDVLVQPDGKILAIGSNGGNGLSAMTITRHTADGSLDPSFANGGLRAISFDGYGTGVAGALTSDGRVVAVGSGNEISSGDPWVVARITPDGTPDASFSGDGQATVTFDGYAPFSSATDVAVTPGNRVVIVGAAEAQDDDPTGVGIARLNADGSPDATFSGDGLTTIGTTDSYEPRVALLPDGKIAVATVAYGETDAGGEALGLQVSRLNADGSLDASFSGDGQQTVDFDHFESVIGLVAQPNGKLVAAFGTFRLNGPYLTGLVRFDADGSLDPTFSGDGKQTIDLDYNYNNGGDLLLRADGSLVLSANRGIALFNPDGSLDTSFSGDGLVPRNDPLLDDLGRAALDADGSLLVAGSSNGDLALLRYQMDEVPSGDVTPPDTSITSGPSGTTDDTTPTFVFASTEAGSSFECRVDTSAFAPCSSPHTVPAVAEGTHEFSVRAIDPAGNADPSPASRSFSVSLPRPPPSDPLPSAGLPQAPGPLPAAPPPTATSSAVVLATRAALRRGPRGRRVLSFQLSGRAPVTLTIVKLKAGVRRGGQCVKSTRQPRASQRCDLRVAQLHRTLDPGAQSILLPTLTPGRYRLLLKTRAAGDAGHVMTVSMHVAAR